ncbi:uncharacterized protein KQ657_004091 [Scheffersomyces spartinae]|uniref:L domain-like protein n=1 Tax=Scheffersomyces spartinae TaxID=45513 RepID=A0A9P7VC32_9ASCO|nr:uncharacterized protein KQ657_004091 [Scheffersomyces spartinae]KAG7194980.1 hypothetical protein KQ657_004091 [Scheffersomyces spartinae]
MESKSLSTDAATNEDFDGEFLRDYFPRLPDIVIIQILDQLTNAEFVTECILPWKNSELRKIVVGTFYSGELHLRLTPTRRPHACNPKLAKYIDIFQIMEIEQFLLENPDINPETIKLYTGRHMLEDLVQLLKKYTTRFTNQVKNLELYIENVTTWSPELVDELLAFPNIRKLQLTNSPIGSSLLKSSNFQNHPCITELVLLGHGITNWSKIQFPPNLTHLDASWTTLLSPFTMHLPPTIEHIYWNGSGLLDNIWNIKFPPNVQTLMLTSNSINTIDIAKLPTALRTLDLSNNGNKRFVYSGTDKPHWPSNLRSLILSQSSIDDSSLEFLKTVAWPPLLENIRVDFNHMTSLTFLQDLPDSVQYMDLTGTLISNFNIFGDDNEGIDILLHKDGPPKVFKFPSSLTYLNVEFCPNFKVPVSYLKYPIWFSSNLSVLNLGECNLESLDGFILPSSLTKLSLTENKLKDLKYPYWNKLISLKSLLVVANKLEHLDPTVLPPNLEYLDISHNMLTSLEGDYSRLTHLRRILAADNQIESISSKLQLPSLLLLLGLEGNNFTTFDFCFDIPTNLINIKLNENKISSMKFPLSGTASKLQLMELDLTGNVLFKSTRQNNRTTNGNIRTKIDEFYTALELCIGKRVLRRKFNVNSVHEFV